MAKNTQFTFDRYQVMATKVATYPTEEMCYPVLGLAGEAGEVADKFKKLMRDKGVSGFDGIVFEDREALKLELGDTLWYLSEIAVRLGFMLSDVACSNLDKLYDRAERGKLQGEGDDR